MIASHVHVDFQNRVLWMDTNISETKQIQIRRAWNILFAHNRVVQEQGGGRDSGDQRDCIFNIPLCFSLPTFLISYSDCDARRKKASKALSLVGGQSLYR